MAKTKLTKDKHKQLWRDYNATNEFGRPIYTWSELRRKYGLDSTNSVNWIIRKFGGPNRRRKENG